MKAMRWPTPLRRTQVARPVAALLTSVFLALSVSAGFHRGEHDDLGWLPARFHHHDFQWQETTGEAPAPLADHCLACHVTRTLVRFTPSAAPLPESVAPALARATEGAGDIPGRPDFSRTPRAPPAS
jgi:hypothetical protein